MLERSCVNVQIELVDTLSGTTVLMKIMKFLRMLCCSDSTWVE